MRSFDHFVGISREIICASNNNDVIWLLVMKGFLSVKRNFFSSVAREPFEDDFVISLNVFLYSVAFHTTTHTISNDHGSFGVLNCFTVQLGPRYKGQRLCF